MRISPVLLAALTGPFLMEASAAQGFHALVLQQLMSHADGSGLSMSEEERAARPAFEAFTPHAAALGVLGYKSLDEVPAGSVAVHTIAGTMLPEDSWFGWGTRTIGQGITSADAHPNIVAHVGVFRTPGGSTMGLESFAATIAGTTKPFVSYAELMCSAGYWSGSSGNHIFVGGRTAMLGSIGTKAEFLDWAGFYEKLGIKQISVPATASTHKTASFDAALAGDFKPLREEVLDPLNEVFLATVRENRAGKLDAKQEKKLLSGLVFIGEANVSNGLADQLGTFNDAVQLALELADQAPAGKAAKLATSSKNQSMFGKRFPAVAALGGLAGAAVTTALVDAANDELEAADIKGAGIITSEALAQFEATTAAHKKVTDALAAAGVESVEALVADRDKHKADAERLAGLAGASHTTPHRAEGKSDVDEQGADANQQLIDNLDHNKALDNNPLFASPK